MTVRKVDFFSATLLILLSAYVWREAVAMPTEYGKLGPGFFPELLAGCLAAFAVGIFVQAALKRDGGEEKVTPPRRALLIIFGITAIYLGLLPSLGFLATTPAFLVTTGVLIAEDVRKYFKGIVINGVVATIVLYLLFAKLLNVPLP